MSDAGKEADPKLAVPADAGVVNFDTRSDAELQNERNAWVETAGDLLERAGVAEGKINVLWLDALVAAAADYQKLGGKTRLAKGNQALSWMNGHVLEETSLTDNPELALYLIAVCAKKLRSAGQTIVDDWVARSKKGNVEPADDSLDQSHTSEPQQVAAASAGALSTAPTPKAPLVDAGTEDVSAAEAEPNLIKTREELQVSLQSLFESSIPSHLKLRTEFYPLFISWYTTDAALGRGISERILWKVTLSELGIDGERLSHLLAAIQQCSGRPTALNFQFTEEATLTNLISAIQEQGYGLDEMLSVFRAPKTLEGTLSSADVVATVPNWPLLVPIYREIIETTFSFPAIAEINSGSLDSIRFTVKERDILKALAKHMSSLNTHGLSGDFIESAQAAVADTVGGVEEPEPQLPADDFDTAKVAEGIAKDVFSEIKDYEKTALLAMRSAVIAAYSGIIVNVEEVANVAADYFKIDNPAAFSLLIEFLAGIKSGDTNFDTVHSMGVQKALTSVNVQQVENTDIQVGHSRLKTVLRALQPLVKDKYNKAIDNSILASARLKKGEQVAEGQPMEATQGTRPPRLKSAMQILAARKVGQIFGNIAFGSPQIDNLHPNRPQNYSTTKPEEVVEQGTIDQVMAIYQESITNLAKVLKNSDSSLAEKKEAAEKVLAAVSAAKLSLSQQEQTDETAAAFTKLAAATLILHSASLKEVEGFGPQEATDEELRKLLVTLPDGTELQGSPSLVGWTEQVLAWRDTLVQSIIDNESTITPVQEDQLRQVKQTILSLIGNATQVFAITGENEQEERVRSSIRSLAELTVRIDALLGE